MQKLNTPACDIDNLIRISPYAVIYVFRMTIAMLVSLTGCASCLSAKSIMCIAAYISGLTVLERKQTQSKIAKDLKLVTHDALNRLAEEIGGMCHQLALEFIYLLTISNDGFIILDDVVIPKPFSRWISK